MSKFTETTLGLGVFLVLFVVMVVLQRPPSKELIRDPFAVVLGLATAIFASVILVKLVRARRRRDVADKVAKKGLEQHSVSPRPNMEENAKPRRRRIIYLIVTLALMVVAIMCGGGFWFVWQVGEFLREISQIKG
jgi:hypothetical protein